MKNLILFSILLSCHIISYGQSITGKIIGPDNIPISDASIYSLKSHSSAISGPDGRFSIRLSVPEDSIMITLAGMVSKTVAVSTSMTSPFIVEMQFASKQLDEVILNTGYQELPKERSTGSFVKINNTLLNRKVGSDILSRLEGVTSGILFDRRSQSPEQLSANANNIVIRGISTLSENIKSPLVVVDNFPYEGDILNINPNDIESITVLKDAAAASIWGARAGNGVIVISTKKGNYNRPVQVVLNSNITITQAPDLFYNPSISSSDYIDIEKYLFNQGFYDTYLQYPQYFSFSPVTDLLGKQRDGIISETEVTEKINAYRLNDIRKDYEKYIYRKSVQQQYALNLSGGNSEYKYFLSGGYDKGLSNLSGNQNEKINIRFDNSYRLSSKFELQSGILFTVANAKNNNPGGLDVSLSGKTIPPYLKLADDNGNALPIPFLHSIGYTDTVGGGRLFDWKYRPLDELKYADNKTRSQDVLFNIGARYLLNRFLSAEIKYQYESSATIARSHYPIESYFTRDLVNEFSQPAIPLIQYAVPPAGILDQGTSKLESHAGRVQVNFNQKWNKHHDLSAIAGTEIRQSRINSSSHRTYGFRDDILSSTPVDLVNYHTLYNGETGIIPDAASFEGTVSRFVSVYGNAGYTYDNKYTLTASARKDASNLFGVQPNRRGTPLWSAGFNWVISKEAFYKIDWLPKLNARLTYGYSGNVNNVYSPYATIRYLPIVSYGLTLQPRALVIKPADESLSWETIRMINGAIDFSTQNNRLSGSIEAYFKKTRNLLAPAEIDPTVGVSGVYKNSAHLSGKGIDITMHAVLLNKAFKWEMDLLFSYSNDKVTKLLFDASNANGSAIVAGNGKTIIPVEGSSVYSVYSYKWAGLSPETGDPRGYINKEISTDYFSLINQSVLSDLVYQGNALPRYFGSVLNYFSFKGFTISANITFKLDYVFRKNTISYYELYTQGKGHGDFNARWQQPGDELKTNIPSMIYPLSSNYRDAFYAGSQVNVLKGDHIRLQDIRLSYDMNEKLAHSTMLKGMQVYIYLSNLGIIWRANKEHLDPDYSAGNPLYPAPKLAALGLKISF